MKAQALKKFSEKIGYVFRQTSLAVLALTHRSVEGCESNERLEFLGDGIVNFVIADLLYQQFPEAKEGELSRLRATLVNRETLALLAESFDLGAYLLLGPGEIKMGGKMRPSILSCAMEAVMGAVYLDSDFLTIKKLIQQWYADKLETLKLPKNYQDAKTKLQEYLQARQLPLPIYTVTEMTGEGHALQFTVQCAVQAEITLGQGTSRKQAEQRAAKIMLENLLK